MNFVIKNIKRAMLLHWHLNLLILADLILFTVIMFIMLQNYVFSKQIQDAFFSGNQAAQHYYYAIDGDSFESFLNDMENKTPMYEIAKIIRDEIYASPHFIAYDSNPCTLSLFSGTSNPDFPDTLIQYDYLTDESGAPYIDGYVFFENSLEVYDIQLSKGRLFETDDYINADIEKPVSVILGHDFLPFFELGDVISYESEYASDTAIIVGFMEPNTYICDFGDENPNTSTLDKSIIFPLRFPRNEDQLSLKYFEKESLWAFDGGRLVVTDPTIDVQSEINRITAKYGFYPIETFPMDGTAITNTKIISEKNVTLLLVLAIVTTMICLIALSSVLYKRTLKDRATFCVYLTAGIPLWKINLSLLIEMSLWLVLSILPSISISMIEYGTLCVPLWQILVYTGTILMISLAPTFVVIGRSNLDQMIRNQIE